MTPVLEIDGLEKRYQGLRPLRLQALAIAPGERVAVLGVDAGAAEVLVNLVTGASVADRGVVRVLGQNNADISDGDAWLASLDRFGIVSPRAVLLEGATLEQNLAMPFTLQIDPVGPETARGVGAGGGVRAGEGGERGSCSSSPGRCRPNGGRGLTWPVRLRSVRRCWCSSIRPRTCPRRWSRRLPLMSCAVTEARRQATLVLTQDQAFAQQVAHRTLKMEPGDRRVDAGAPGVVLLIARYFVITPQAILGPPLTPDLGSPVVPWSSLPWMIIAEPSASKSDSGPGDSVTRVVTPVSSPVPLAPTWRFGMSPMWKG